MAYRSDRREAKAALLRVLHAVEKAKVGLGQRVGPGAVADERDVVRRQPAIRGLAIGDVGDGPKPFAGLILDFDPQRSIPRHRFPPEIIRHAVWLYHRFALSLRDVEDLLSERGITVSYEAIRHSVVKFGPAGAREASSGAVTSCTKASI